MATNDEVQRFNEIRDAIKGMTPEQFAYLRALIPVIVAFAQDMPPGRTVASVAVVAIETKGHTTLDESPATAIEYRHPAFDNPVDNQKIALVLFDLASNPAAFSTFDVTHVGKSPSLDRRHLN